jgi:GNAT superfamily N-acetyltransferase
LSYADLDALPTGCGSCAFWESAGVRERVCGSVCDEDLVRDWYRRVTDEWGVCGRVAYEDDEVLGFIKYAPSAYFPQAATFNAAPQDPSVPLIACLHIAPDARHRGLGGVLIRSVLRDLSLRGERKVEAFAAARKPAVLDDSPVLGLEFLFRNGFEVSRPDIAYPLLKLDLRRLAAITENLEAVLESLRFPLRIPKRAPVSSMNGR